MNRRLACLAAPLSLAFLALAFLAGPAAGAVSVLTNGAPRSCYLAADSGRRDDSALTLCVAAVYESAGTKNYVPSLINRGIVYLNRRDGRAALADFDNAIRLQPNQPDAHTNRGAALIFTGDLQGAIIASTRALELKTAEPYAAHFNRALAHEQLGDVRAAYLDYRAALDAKPDWALPKAELARFNVSAAP